MYKVARVQIVVVFKVYWGDAKEKLCSSVVDVPLDYLVMGCRGLSSIKRCDCPELFFPSNEFILCCVPILCSLVSGCKKNGMLIYYHVYWQGLHGKRKQLCGKQRTLPRYYSEVAAQLSGRLSVSC